MTTTLGTTGLLDSPSIRWEGKSHISPPTFEIKTFLVSWKGRYRIWQDQTSDVLVDRWFETPEAALAWLDKKHDLYTYKVITWSD